MGRRWGKSVLGGVLTLNVLRQHGKAAWVVPTYKNGRGIWRYVQGVCAPLAQVRVLDISKAERMVTTSRGGMLGIYSADNIDAVRGDWFHVVVVDEAARVSEEARNDAIMPTLADADGQEIDISTPKGLNWFYTEWTRGRDNMRDVAAFKAPTSDNPSPQIQRAAALAKERVTARTYQQEWEAEFVADGNYFQGADECCVLTEPDRPADHDGHTLGMGLDWGKSEDFTAGTIGCRECDRVVDWFHLNTFDYIFQRKVVRQYYDKWRHERQDGPGRTIENTVRVLPERNSMGEPNIEMLRADGISVELGPDGKYGFNMSATTKPTLIENMALALLRKKKLPKVYREEFVAYEVKSNSNGAPVFSAPEGGHDDRVISAALENQLAISGVQFW